VQLCLFFFFFCNIRRMANIEEPSWLPPCLQSYALLLCASKVHNVFKVKFLFDRKSLLPDETSPF